MYLNCLRLNIVRQSHCFCKLQLLNNNCAGSLSKPQLKVHWPYTVRVCGVNTDNRDVDQTIIEKDKDTSLEVYRGSISKIIYKVKAFSLISSVFGLASQPIVLKNAIDMDANVYIIIGATAFISFFIFVTPVLLHLLTKRYILTLDYCPKTDQYSATTYSFFLKNKIDKFAAKDIFVPDIPGLLTTFEVNKKPFFVDKESFLDLEHYKKIMGYDKPLDFKLRKEPPENN